MTERDQRDSARADSPLAQAPDAVYLDSTQLSVAEVEEEILKIVRARDLQRKGVPLNDLLVMKFGGTSVGSAERMRVVCAARSGRKPQAPGSRRGLGDVENHRSPARARCATPKAATAPAWRPTFARSASATNRPAANSFPPTVNLRFLAKLLTLIDEFARIVNGMAMLNERPPRSVDEGVAVGERLSAILVSEHLIAEGTPAEAVNAWDVIVTDAVFGNASPLMDRTRE